MMLMVMVPCAIVSFMSPGYVASSVLVESSKKQGRSKPEEAGPS